jgi:hypothetical protein
MKQKPQMIRKGKKKCLTLGVRMRERKEEKGKKIHPEVVNNLN